MDPFFCGGGDGGGGGGGDDDNDCSYGWCWKGESRRKEKNVSFLAY